MKKRKKNRKRDKKWVGGRLVGRKKRRRGGKRGQKWIRGTLARDVKII